MEDIKTPMPVNGNHDPETDAVDELVRIMTEASGSIVRPTRKAGDLLGDWIISVIDSVFTDNVQPKN